MGSVGRVCGAVNTAKFFACSLWSNETIDNPPAGRDDPPPPPTAREILKLCSLLVFFIVELCVLLAVIVMECQIWITHFGLFFVFPPSIIEEFFSYSNDGAESSAAVFRNGSAVHTQKCTARTLCVCFSI